MTTSRTIALSVLILIALTVALTAYIFGQRYQVSSTNDAVFIVDTFTGDIDA